MVERELKLWKEFWEDVASGRKSFEIRFDDRGFAVGDVLVLQEYDPGVKGYTGRQMRRLVTHITDLETLATPGWMGRPDWIVMAIVPDPDEETPGGPAQMGVP